MPCLFSMTRGTGHLMHKSSLTFYSHLKVFWAQFQRRMVKRTFQIMDINRMDNRLYTFLTQIYGGLLLIIRHVWVKEVSVKLWKESGQRLLVVRAGRWNSRRPSLASLTNLRMLSLRSDWRMFAPKCLNRLICLLYAEYIWLGITRSLISVGRILIEASLVVNGILFLFGLVFTVVDSRRGSQRLLLRMSRRPLNGHWNHRTGPTLHLDPALYRKLSHSWHHRTLGACTTFRRFAECELIETHSRGLCSADHFRSRNIYIQRLYDYFFFETCLEGAIFMLHVSLPTLDRWSINGMGLHY